MSRTETVTRQRQRIGSDFPYRDDPNAPPSVRLESFTRGGYGPTPVIPTETNVYSHKSKRNAAAASWSRWCWNVLTDCGRVVVTGKRNVAHDTLYYQDDFNDLSWSCTVGTTEEHGIWLNRSDPAGTVMAALVWVLIGYSSLTMILLAKTGGIPAMYSMLYSILATLALACHVKTSLTDPGSVPSSAVPTEAQRLLATQHNYKLCMCSQCQTFKPTASHHCRICNRCISRMDHHCPWMNNCVGAGNMKHFLLFLIYTWSCSVFCLVLLGWNYFFCASQDCTFNVVLTQLVRIMTILSMGSFLFTSSMLMNVIYGILTGVGTIDRLKKKATGTLHESMEEPIPLHFIFGIGPYYTWPFPVDPLFEDYDVVMGYATPQRLLREQMRESSSGPTVVAADSMSVVSRDSYGMPV